MCSILSKGAMLKQDPSEIVDLFIALKNSIYI
jgi:hypothetical protein